MKIIGLMGGSGAGKSTVAEILKKHNANIIDCDKISHQIMEPNTPAWQETVKTFGNEILNPNNTINRRALANIVFNNRQRLAELEEITHKYIKQEVYSRLETAKKANLPLTVIDAPLLVEAGLDKSADSVWLVNADCNLRVERIAKRDNITKQEAINRLKNQPDPKSLEPYANVIIDTTNVTLEELEKDIVNML